MRCKNCNKKISQRNVFCNNKCQMEFQYKSFITKWLQGETKVTKGEGCPSSHIRKYLFKKYNNKCCKCGWGIINKYSGKIPLTINHKDGNSENHKKENLELLCPNCHSLTETFGNLNKGKGRKKRRMKAKDQEFNSH